MQITLNNTPIFSSSSLREDLSDGMPLDNRGLFRPLEMIAFEGTEVIIEGEEGEFYQVQLPCYPATNSLYVPKVFIGSGVPKKRKMPSSQVILERLYATLGLPYIWGGNCSAGVPEMLSLFPPKNSLSKEEETRWTFRGLDCSGLLYEATEGLVPRNTSWMKNFGEPVTGELQPLDMIVYEGHVLYVVEDGKVIESCLEDGGVVVHELQPRLQKIQKPLYFRRFLLFC